MARVLVGMSGGVDSSVAAAVLAESGHEVIGVSLQLYDHSEGGRAARCCSPDDFKDARAVAALLGIPYYVINEEERFGRKVLDYFVTDYREGRTPNPCVRCNGEVKFDVLVRLAEDLGAVAVATGHYARLSDVTSGAEGDERQLLRGVDSDRDQSYFLFDLTPRQRAMALFPLGGMLKTQVRDRARALGLATAEKQDSQDVCFVEGGDYRAFVASRIALRGEVESPGEIVDTGGRTLGVHEGVSAFTVGQRRGLGISSSRRLFVVSVEPESQRVVVGGEEDLMTDAIDLTGVRLLPPASECASAFEATVRIRYRHTGVHSWIEPDGRGAARVVFSQPVKGVSPGQAAVFYDGDIVLGGGWIQVARPLAAAAS